MIAELEKAIGALEYMKDRFSNSPTLDMSDELLSFLSDLLRVGSLSSPTLRVCVCVCVGTGSGGQVRQSSERVSQRVVCHH